MDSTGLKKFPPSAGRLQKLEILSLSKNKLEDLPVTLGFCENLMVLNLQGNKLRRIPGIVLHLKNLKKRDILTTRCHQGGMAFSCHHTSMYVTSPPPTVIRRKFTIQKVRKHSAQKLYSHIKLTTGSTTLCSAGNGATL